MHDIKAIRDDAGAFVRGLSRRGMADAQGLADNLLKKDKALRDLLRTGGTLITANLNHGGTAETVRKALFDGKSWRSALVDEEGETAVSVKL